MLPSTALPWLPLPRRREIWSLIVHPQQSCGSTLCKFKGSFRDLAVPSRLQTEFLDTRIGLVKGSTIDNYLDLNKINNVQVSLSISLQAYVFTYRVTKKMGAITLS